MENIEEVRTWMRKALCCVCGSWMKRSMAGFSFRFSFLLRQCSADLCRISSYRHSSRRFWQDGGCKGMRFFCCASPRLSAIFCAAFSMRTHFPSRIRRRSPFCAKFAGRSCKNCRSCRSARSRICLSARSSISSSIRWRARSARSRIFCPS